MSTVPSPLMTGAALVMVALQNDRSAAVAAIGLWARVGTYSSMTADSTE